jgi:hypothetical protein
MTPNEAFRGIVFRPKTTHYLADILNFRAESKIKHKNTPRAFMK